MKFKTFFQNIKIAILKIIRSCISFILRYTPSPKVRDLLVWPVSKRLFSKGYTEIVEIFPGILMRVYGDMEDMVNKILMFTSKYVELAWEPGTARLVRKLAQSSKCSVVAGSHIGYYPIILGKTNSLSKVYAFEPNPINFERLNDNVKLNSLLNVYTENRALGNIQEKKKMYFDYGQSSFLESSRKHNSDGIVSITTLDIFFSDKSPHPDLLVLDAEGYEMNILMGAKGIIEKNHPDIIFELNQSALEAAGHTQQALINFFIENGYKVFIIDEGNHGLTFKNIETKLVDYSDSGIRKNSFVNVFATKNIKKL